MLIAFPIFLLVSLTLIPTFTKSINSILGVKNKILGLLYAVVSPIANIVVTEILA
jgi:hypothetical protein